MAGIEPASERLNPRISTSVVALICRQRNPEQQNDPPAIRWDPKVLFCTGRESLCSTPALCRPHPHRQEIGRGGRDLTRRSFALVFAYAARGIAAY